MTLAEFNALAASRAGEGGAVSSAARAYDPAPTGTEARLALRRAVEDAVARHGAAALYPTGSRGALENTGPAGAVRSAASALAAEAVRLAPGDGPADTLAVTLPEGCLRVLSVRLSMPSHATGSAPGSGASPAFAWDRASALVATPLEHLSRPARRPTKGDPEAWLGLHAFVDPDRWASGGVGAALRGPLVPALLLRPVAPGVPQGVVFGDALVTEAAPKTADARIGTVVYVADPGLPASAGGVGCDGLPEGVVDAAAWLLASRLLAQDPETAGRAGALDARYRDAVERLLARRASVTRRTTAAAFRW